MPDADSRRDDDAVLIVGTKPNWELVAVGATQVDRILFYSLADAYEYMGDVNTDAVIDVSGQGRTLERSASKWNDSLLHHLQSSASLVGSPDALKVMRRQSFMYIFRPIGRARAMADQVKAQIGSVTSLLATGLSSLDHSAIE